MRLQDKNNIALVLSGGGIKAAAFHIGVCMALREKGFEFVGGLKTPEINDIRPGADISTSKELASTKEQARRKNSTKKQVKMYVGSSAGALISTILAAGFSVDSLIEAFESGNKLLPNFYGEKRSTGKLRPIKYWDIFSLNHQGMLNIVPNPFKKDSLVSGGIETLIKEGVKVNGLFTTRGIERYLREHVLPTNNFEDLKARLFVIGTQLNHSRKVVFGDFEKSSKSKDIKFANYATISQSVAASASLPPVFAPYGIRNEKGKEIFFFDGEIRDTLSTHVAADHGADFVIASYSIQPYHYNPKMGSLHNYGIPLILNQALYQVVQQKIARHVRYQKDVRLLLNTVDGYFKEAELPNEHREKLLSILEEKVSFNRNVDYVYIHPDPSDYEMFFVDHFSLNTSILARIVKIGFKSALRVLRHHNI